MTEKKSFNLKEFFFSLRMRFILVFILALAIGVGIYFLVRLTAMSYIDSVYIAEENKEAREREYLNELQAFITENKISSDQTGMISKWARENKYVYLLLQKDNEIFFTSDDATDGEEDGETPPEFDGEEDGSGTDGGSEDSEKDDTGATEDEKNEENEEKPAPDGEGEESKEPSEGEAPGEGGADSENPDAGGEDGEPGESGGSSEPGEGEEGEAGSVENADGTEGGEEDAGEEDEKDDEKDDEKPENPGGVTVTYPTREELLAYAKANDMHLVKFEDRELLASFAEFTEYLYYDLTNILSFIAATIVVIAVMLVYIRRITGRIIKLGENVNLVAEGDSEHRINANGNDEITRLASNVETMRSTMVENFRREKAALDSNTELITSMSHDIRTPLTVLLGYMDVMRAHATDDEVMQGYIKAAEKTAMRLKKLSDDMFGYFLVFGRGESEIELEEYDAITIISQMLAEHILLLSENGYEVSLEGEENPQLSGMRISVDAAGLLRIFDNSFSNIYKYADKKFPVKIRIFRDTCSIFVEFSNTVRSDSEKVESNGIGFKTSKKLAELMGGAFEFYPLENQFVVKLTLPFTGGESAEA